jgi:hypothetical protein
MLEVLQQQLSDIYHLGRVCDVRDYLITDPTMAQALGQGRVLGDSEETLLMLQDGDELSLSLFLDAELLDRLRSGNPLDALRADMLDDLWKVFEGLSHFNCVVWKATQDRTVTLLELELQGEIDKYVGTMLLAMNQSDTSLLHKLHGWLFENIRFHDELDSEQRERYRSANDYAARFCHGLKQKFIDDGAVAIDQLRHFYRLQLGDKISHIHSQAIARV